LVHAVAMCAFASAVAMCALAVRLGARSGNVRVCVAVTNQLVCGVSAAIVCPCAWKGDLTDVSSYTLPRPSSCSHGFRSAFHEILLQHVPEEGPERERAVGRRPRGCGAQVVEAGRAPLGPPGGPRPFLGAEFGEADGVGGGGDHQRRGPQPARAFQLQFGCTRYCVVRAFRLRFG
jgi:hypothetical protein